jgi:AraC-like DNA-binding protein
MKTSSKQALSRLWYTPDRGISIHIFRYHAGLLDCLEHSHGEFSITISLESKLGYWIGGQVNTVKRGEILVIEPGEWHAGVYTLEPPPLGLTISVGEATLKRLLTVMGIEAGSLHDVEIHLSRLTEEGRLTHLGEEMHHEILNSAPGRDAVISSLVTQFLISLLRFCVQPAAAIERHDVARQLPAAEMVRTVEYMNRHRKSSFSLGGLCSEIGTSQSRFIQLFRNSTNTSPLVFYNRILVNKAKSLLNHSGLSIKQIAFALEFQSESHFCTLFRSLSGTTPNQFRLSGREQSSGL